MQDQYSWKVLYKYKMYRFYVNCSRIVGHNGLAIMFCYCFKVRVMILMDALNSTPSVPK